MFKSTSTIIHPIQYCLSMKITCTFFFRIPLFITSSSFFFKKLLDIKKNPSYLYYTNVSLYVNSTIPFSGMKGYHIYEQQHVNLLARVVGSFWRQDLQRKKRSKHIMKIQLFLKNFELKLSIFKVIHIINTLKITNLNNV